MTGSKCMHMLRPLLLLEMEHRTSEMLSMCSTTEYIPMLTHLAQLLLRRERSTTSTGSSFLLPLAPVTSG